MTASDDDRDEPVLVYGERYAWGYLVSAIAVPVAYAAVTLTRMDGAAPAEYAFQIPLLIALGASIVLNMFLAPAPERGRDVPDERDRAIARRADIAAYRALAVGALAVFALAMFEAAPFWIANTLYLAFVASAATESIAKIVSYRRGW